MVSSGVSFSRLTPGGMCFCIPLCCHKNVGGPFNWHPEHSKLVSKRFNQLDCVFRSLKLAPKCASVNSVLPLAVPYNRDAVAEDQDTSLQSACSPITAVAGIDKAMF